MDEAALKAMLEKEGVDAVIHCAALKAVGESVQKPLEYYRNNITGTLTLMDVIETVPVLRILYSVLLQLRDLNGSGNMVRKKMCILSASASPKMING